MRLVNRATRAEKSKDAGIAMVVAIALMGIVAILVLALVSVALSEARGSGRDRQRSGAVMVAEGRVDTLVSQIQSAAPASLPCDDAATTDGGDVTVMSDDQDVSAVVTYYDAAGGAVDCANLASTVLTQAKVVVTSTSNQIVGTSAARRTVETLLELTPTYGNDLDNAIFGNAGVSVSNNGTVRTPDGALDADVYTNGDYICPNGSNQEYHGSIFAQGSITLAGSCTVLVDVHAGTFVNVSHNQADVNGRVLAAGGNALVQGDVGQQVRATGTASGGACVPSTKCVSGATDISAPPAQPFPPISWAGAIPAAWNTELGFTNVVPATCGARTGSGDKMDGVGEWIKANASSLPANTVVLANCAGVIDPTTGKAQRVYMSGIDLDLNKNLAIFASNGFHLDGAPTIRSTSPSEARNLYLMHPYTSLPTCVPGTPGIYVGNNVEFQRTANVMMYSPCDIDKRNRSEITGQVYSGGVARISQNTDMTYVMLPMAGLSAVSSTVESYDVNIVYKRENV